jgi:hypothetical protein
VTALEAWLEAARIGEGAVFRRVFNRRAQRVGDQRLAARNVASVVKTAAAKLGFDPATFGGHSLRSGLVTTAVKRGVNLMKVCDQTGHKSLEMLRVYTRDAELFAGNAAAGLLWASGIGAPDHDTNQAVMSTKGKKPVAAAERMRLLLRRNGLRCLRVTLADTEIDCLVAKGFLKPERRHVHSAIQSAIDDFICHALGAEQDQIA